jgi:hypothetical protein
MVTMAALALLELQIEVVVAAVLAAGLTTVALAVQA